MIRPDRIAADWIAVDWGTSQLRVWAMAEGKPLAEASSGDGMGTLAPGDFEPALLALISDWLGPTSTPGPNPGPTPVIACGMVGARQGWAEAPYLPVPARPGTSALRVPATDPRIAVHILPGLSQSAPPDVMRGEETQIAGHLAAHPQWDGILCLPGTHCKWVHASAGEVISFRTFLTGELFALLSTHSVLRHSTAGADFDRSAFAEAVSDTLSRPETLAARLFSLRADDLLHGTPAPQTRARLSGLLIGAELAAARPYWLGQEVVIVGSEATAPLYLSALAAQGVTATRADTAALTLAGLTAAFHALKDTA